MGFFFFIEKSQIVHQNNHLIFLNKEENVQTASNIHLINDVHKSTVYCGSEDHQKRLN